MPNSQTASFWEFGLSSKVQTILHRPFLFKSIKFSQKKNPSSYTTGVGAKGAYWTHKRHRFENLVCPPKSKLYSTVRYPFYLNPSSYTMQPARSNPTNRVGSFFKSWWVGLGCDLFIYFFVGRVEFRSLESQIRLIQPDLLIFNTYFKIYYIILFFFFLPIFLNKTQTLSFPRIVCVGLMLCLWLFDYNFLLFVVVLF